MFGPRLGSVRQGPVGPSFVLHVSELDGVQGHYILNVYINVEFAAKQYSSGELAFAAQTRAH